MIQTIWNDLRFAARTLRKRPLFVVSAVTVLAVGIGANVAVFTAVKAALFEPPAYQDPDRLVLLDLTVSSQSRPGPQRAYLWTHPEFLILSETPNRLADPISAYAAVSFNLAAEQGAVLSMGEVVTHEYHSMLGISAALGRAFMASDEEVDAPLVAMIAHSIWINHYGADSSVVGRTVTLNGSPVTVVGVAPTGFTGLSGSAGLWVPTRTAERLLDMAIFNNSQAHLFGVVGRLRNGATLEAAQAQMAAVANAVRAAFPDPDPDAIHGGSARGLLDARVSPKTRTSLLLLTVGAALVLLVTCANLAAFLLARALERSREAAIRLAIGGRRLRVVWNFLSESVLLSALGCVVALWVARYGVELLVATWPSEFLSGGWNLSSMDLDAIRIDGGVLAFAVGLSLVTSLVFGLLPAIRCTHTNIAEVLSSSTDRIMGRRTKVDLSGAIVILEIALAFLLLTGASLLVRSLHHLQEVDRGIQAQNVLIFDYALSRWSSWGESPIEFQTVFLERLRLVPGVVTASVTCTPPLERHCMFSRVTSAGSTEYDASSGAPLIGVQYVREGYFETFGIDVVQGRVFDRLISASSPPALIISERAAGILFPETDAVGQTVALNRGAFAGEQAQVIGVVADVLYDQPEQGITADAYVSMTQDGFGSTAVVRTSGEPLGALQAVRATLNDLDANIPISNVRTLEQIAAASVSDTALLRRLFAVFAAVTLILAASGVWGVVANRVTHQQRELALRMALGADSASVIRRVVRQGLMLAGAGIAIGALAAWLATRALESLLYNVSPLDPLSLGAAAAVLVGVTTVAAYVPANQATRIEPMEVLRAE
jgi:predicted permease